MNKIILATLLLLSGAVQSNEFHPDFQLLNSEGQHWQRGDSISQEFTCGQCHNAAYIKQTLSPHHLTDDTHVERLRKSLLPSEPQKTETALQCLICHNADQSTQLADFADDSGLVAAASLTLSSPTSEACGHCHSLAQTSQTPLELNEIFTKTSMFGLTGEIFSGQRISHSALNIANKENLSYAFDAHAERVLSCVDCHSSANNPVAPTALDDSKHLRFDPRKLSAHDYFYQPSHAFDQAHSCESCHQVENTHTWLPYLQQHLQKLTCESCHANWLPAPAFSAIENMGGEIKTEWRGLDTGLIRGYTPWLLPNKHGKLAPYNVIAVSDGKANYGVAKAIHHSINRARATRQCADCHNNPSKLLQALPIAPVNLSLPDSFLQDPRPDLSQLGFYIIGTDTVPLIDWIGVALVFFTLLAVSLHCIGRYLSLRRHGAHMPPRERVYMYSFYQRLWHWLQALVILLLLFTGAAIHKPWLFAWMGFAQMVLIHNILGGILFANALLALFYHLASGEIKQFIPMPSDIFVRSFEQLEFYTKGIFQRAPHPFVKTPQQKLNPLQKMAYFGLLNILLPAQMLTGIAMWGVQHWPGLTHITGGLSVLGPIHTLLAWSFAAFIIMHIYLTTTSGPNPLSGIKAMLDGWEDVEIERSTRNE